MSLSRARSMFFLLLPLLVGLLVPAAASAEVTFRGTINTDTIWRASDSPIVLTGDVTVASHATLTIEPGTEVRVATSDELESGFDPDRVELLVQGRLVADGTPEAPVVFRSTASDRDGWVGLILAPQAQPSVLRHVEIRQASQGIWARQSAALVLEHVLLQDNEMAIRWDGDAPLNLVRSELRGFEDGLVVSESGEDIEVLIDASRVVGGSRLGVGIEFAPRVSATIHRSDILGAGLGLFLPAGASLDLRNSVVAGNVRGGLRLVQGEGARIEVVNNTIDINVRDLTDRTTAGVGIEVLAVTSASDFIIRNNSITRHGTAGVRREGGGTPPAVDHNNAWGNGVNYSGLSEGVGSLSVNPLYRQTLGYYTVSEEQDFIAPNNNNHRTFADPMAHRSRSFVRLTNRYTFCNSRFTRSWLEHGASRQEVTSHPSTGAFQTWTGYALSSSVVHTYNRSTTSDCNIVTDGRVQEVEWSYPDVDSINYRVEPSSPLIDAGSAIDAPDEDRDGSERPYDGNVDGTARVDIGAYEWRENLPPVAVANQTRHLVLPDTEITFDGRQSFDPDGTIVRHTWTFGEGDSVDAAVVSRTFSTLGEVSVTLTVEDDRGETDTAVVVVEVADNLPPIARLGGDRFADVGESLTFDGSTSSDPDGTIVLYEWNFGDGSPGADGLAVTHSYARAGVFEVTLTVTDNRGATGSASVFAVIGGGSGGEPLLPPSADGGPDRRVDVGETVDFDGSGSSSPNGEITSWSWSFGDGSTASGAEVSHSWSEAGLWLVRLTVTDDVGLTGEAIIAVQVGSTDPGVPGTRAPVAVAGPSRVAELGDALTFDGSASRALDGELTDWAWTFGDGEDASGESVSHTYGEAGLFIVRLTVTDSNGATASDLTTVTVIDPDSPGPGPGQPGDGPAPVAVAGDDVAVNAGTAVTFSAAGSTVRDPLEATYSWNFGDGSTAEGLSARHTWDEGGQYTVTLTVRDDLGRSSTDTLSADVNALPIADAGGDRSATVGTAITLDGGLSWDPDGEVVDWSWRFGDGASASGETVSHAWDATGSYTVTLTVEDDRGARGTASSVVTVSERGAAGPGEGSSSGEASGTGGTSGTGGGAASAEASGSQAAGGSEDESRSEDGDGSGSGSSGGCSSAPVGAPAWPTLLLILGLLGMRRRSQLQWG